VFNHTKSAGDPIAIPRLGDAEILLKCTSLLSKAGFSIKKDVMSVSS
jgi:hypothetical protein